jgi:hypothetical protein
MHYLKMKKNKDMGSETGLVSFLPYSVGLGSHRDNGILTYVSHRDHPDLKDVNTDLSSL